MLKRLGLPQILLLNVFEYKFEILALEILILLFGNKTIQSDIEVYQWFKH